MYELAEVGVALHAVQVIENVVHGHHVGAVRRSRTPERMRDVNEIAVKPADDVAEFEIAANPTLLFVEANGVEVRLKRSEFPQAVRHADQEVLVGCIEPS